MLGHKISTDITINTLMCVILAQLYISYLTDKVHKKQHVNHYKQAWLQNISC